MDDFYDKHQAALVLGIHPESLLRSVRRGTRKLTVYVGKAYKTHNKYFFSVAEVQRLAEQERALRS